MGRVWVTVYLLLVICAILATITFLMWSVINSKRSYKESKILQS